ncbi:hypothetical protein BpHYR1_051146 [Brachionus plicatilis]|uniref:Uncharacterized protein n=1 Tax=Brachionus plicatilis TaxID=10195 RepID=A0A3M7SUT6_BRAPC|nr:hypothetical protein BpHYR1_051146 [Brachionus plicatilis]
MNHLDHLNHIIIQSFNNILPKLGKKHGAFEFFDSNLTQKKKILFDFTLIYCRVLQNEYIGGAKDIFFKLKKILTCLIAVNVMTIKRGIMLVYGFLGGSGSKNIRIILSRNYASELFVEVQTRLEEYGHGFSPLQGILSIISSIFGFLIISGYHGIANFGSKTKYGNSEEPKHESCHVLDSIVTPPLPQPPTPASAPFSATLLNNI